MVFLTDPRQLGKTTLSRWLLAQSGGQYLNYDVADDLRLIVQQRWSPRAPLLVLDELQKNAKLENLAQRRVRRQTCRAAVAGHRQRAAEHLPAKR